MRSLKLEQLLLQSKTKRPMMRSGTSSAAVLFCPYLVRYVKRYSNLQSTQVSEAALGLCLTSTNVFIIKKVGSQYLVPEGSDNLASASTETSPLGIQALKLYRDKVNARETIQLLNIFYIGEIQFQPCIPRDSLLIQTSPDAARRCVVLGQMDYLFSDYQLFLEEIGRYWRPVFALASTPG